MAVRSGPLAVTKHRHRILAAKMGVPILTRKKTSTKQAARAKAEKFAIPMFMELMKRLHAKYPEASKPENNANLDEQGLCDKPSNGKKVSTLQMPTVTGGTIVHGIAHKKIIQSRSLRPILPCYLAAFLLNVRAPPPSSLVDAYALVAETVNHPSARGVGKGIVGKRLLV